MLEVRNTKSVSLSKTKLLAELVHFGGFGEQPASSTLPTPRKVLVVQSRLTVCDPIDCRTVTHQLSLSMEFSRQVHWRGLSFPFPWNHKTQGSNQGLPLYRQIVYHLSHQGSLRLSEVALVSRFVTPSYTLKDSGSVASSILSVFLSLHQLFSLFLNHLDPG